MSTHKDCGENIHWFQRDNETWHPPMEFAGQTFVNIDGKLIETTGYRPHRCDPEKIVAWQAWLAQMVELKGPDSYEATISAHVAASERARQEQWDFVLETDCTSCEAEAGSRCYNLSIMKRTGEIVETRYPHPARVAEADRSQ